MGLNFIKLVSGISFSLLRPSTTQTAYCAAHTSKH